MNRKTDNYSCALPEDAWSSSPSEAAPSPAEAAPSLHHSVVMSLSIQYQVSKQKDIWILKETWNQIENEIVTENVYYPQQHQIQFVDMQYQFLWLYFSRSYFVCVHFNPEFQRHKYSLGDAIWSCCVLW